MRILFDQGTPQPLRYHLSGHVETVSELGWSQLSNGALLSQAEPTGFGVLVTTDQNLSYQQNLTGRRLAIVVLLSTSWPKIQLKLALVKQLIDAARSGDYTEIPI